MAGLNIMENDDIDTSNPIIRFFARDVASTFNLADIEYATTSKALSFNGADDYTFNDGDFTVVNGDVTLSTADDRTNNVACYLANGTLGYCSDQPDGSGQCTCNSN